MANLPEKDVYPEGIIRLETTMTAKGGDVVYDAAGNLVDGFLNAPLQQLAERTSWLKRNSGSSGGSPVEDMPSMFDELVTIGQLTPGCTYILREPTSMMVHSNEQKTLFEQKLLEFFGQEVVLADIPVGSEFHFICATNPQNVFVESADDLFEPPVENNPPVVN